MLSNLRDKNVYHGSYMIVKEPYLSKCKKGKDFGQGFYITTDRNQAIAFSKMIARRLGYSKGVLNIYKFTNFDGLSIHEFNGTDKDWLHCVVGYRNGKYRYFTKPFKDYEVLLGKIADDDTSRTINAYMAGTFGPVGSDIAVNMAVQMFLTSTLNNQICFKTDNALERIKFFRSEDIWL